jgi:hypothetical protein
MLTLGLAGVSSAAGAPADLPPTPTTALQTADRFAAIVYTYKAAWYPGHGRNMGKRDIRYASAPMDTILRSVSITPEIFASKINWTPKIGILKRRHISSGGAVVMGIELPIVQTIPGGAPIRFTVYVRVHVKKIRGYWKVVGAHLRGVNGPDRYCVFGGPSGDLYCNFFPPGSD